MPLHKYAIAPLAKEDIKIISFIKNRLSRMWKLPVKVIENILITPALNNHDFPFVFVIKMDDIFAGMIALSLEKEGYFSLKNQPWINALYIFEDFRKQGIGETLIEHAKQVAKQHGYNHLYLDTASARDYYEHIGGWEFLGTARWEEGDKDVSVMRAKL